VNPVTFRYPRVTLLIYWQVASVRLYPRQGLRAPGPPVTVGAGPRRPIQIAAHQRARSERFEALAVGTGITALAVLLLRS
jgi:hypothetical protein